MQASWKIRPTLVVVKVLPGEFKPYAALAFRCTPFALQRGGGVLQLNVSPSINWWQNARHTRGCSGQPEGLHLIWQKMASPTPCPSFHNQCWDKWCFLCWIVLPWLFRNLTRLCINIDTATSTQTGCNIYSERELMGKSVIYFSVTWPIFCVLSILTSCYSAGACVKEIWDQNIFHILLGTWLEKLNNSKKFEVFETMSIIYFTDLLFQLGFYITS